MVERLRNALKLRRLFNLGDIERDRRVFQRRQEKVSSRSAMVVIKDLCADAVFFIFESALVKRRRRRRNSWFATVRFHT
ncbi:hypothetical protein PV326_007935, partial [Microctonus aethiopoides]